MNRSDYILLGIVIFLISISFLFLYTRPKLENKKAVVYYENKNILEIDLTTEEKKEYIVDGYLGEVKIIKDNDKIKVDSETSPLHLCSRQGYIKESYESIICLPNKIIIKIEAKSELDAMVG